MYCILTNYMETCITCAFYLKLQSRHYPLSMIPNSKEITRSSKKSLMHYDEL